VTCVFRDLFLGYISKVVTIQVSFTESELQSRKLAERSEARGSEENKRSACEDFVCGLEELRGAIEDFMCAIVQWYWECVI
jgi:hypothetical protein